MSFKDVHLLDINRVNGNWSLHKGEVSCMEVDSISLYEVPRYNIVLGVGENATEPVVF
jgi:hypothetical protein